MTTNKVRFVPKTPSFEPAVYRCILKDDPRNDCYRFVFRFGAHCVTLDEHGCCGHAGWMDDEVKRYRSIERLAEYPQPKAATPCPDDRWVKRPSPAAPAAATASEVVTINNPLADFLFRKSGLSQEKVLQVMALLREFKGMRALVNPETISELMKRLEEPIVDAAPPAPAVEGKDLPDEVGVWSQTNQGGYEMRVVVYPDERGELMYRHIALPSYGPKSPSGPELPINRLKVAGPSPWIQVAIPASSLAALKAKCASLRADYEKQRQFICDDRDVSTRAIERMETKLSTAQATLAEKDAVIAAMEKAMLYDAHENGCCCNKCSLVRLALAKKTPSPTPNPRSET